MLNRRPLIPCFGLLLLANLTGSLHAQDANPSAPTQPTTRAESVRVQINGIRNTNGDIGCGIFNTAEGYPEDTTKAYA